MSDYIEREKVLKYQDELEPCICCSIGQDATELFTATRDSSLINYIQSIPAADVRPVKRGKWGNRWICSNMCGYEYACSCSVCGNPTYRMSLMEKMPNFCPNCGADMREVLGDE